MVRSTSLAVIAAAVTLVGCAPTDEPAADLPFEPQYQSIKTVLFDDDLVSFRVAMTGARDNQDVADYAECAAAQYALIRGYGFTRHVRTIVSIEGSIWHGDAVYTISPTLPEGLRTIDAEVAVQNCATQGIPTV
ncbi:MAG: hypothetical protein ACU0CA_08475 [Paracoccaceae bacterium]